MVARIGRFALVGGAATLTHYLVALGSAQVVSLYLANLFGFCTAVAISYFGHQRFTFGVKPAHGRQFWRFALVSLAGLLANYAVLYMVHAAGAPDWLALAFAICVVPIATFALTRVFVFPLIKSESTSDHF